MRLNHHVDGANDGDGGEDEKKNGVHLPLAQQRDQKPGYQQIDEGHWKQDLPGKSHELVVAESGQSASDPDEQEQDDADLRKEPDSGTRTDCTAGATSAAAIPRKMMPKIGSVMRSLRRAGCKP